MDQITFEILAIGLQISLIGLVIAMLIISGINLKKDKRDY
tara:strand:- start:18 stop:137 length:120 start_codon:yes stop_codon:yes gene_type:complete